MNDSKVAYYFTDLRSSIEILKKFSLTRNNLTNIMLTTNDEYTSNPMKIRFDIDFDKLKSDYDIKEINNEQFKIIDVEEIPLKEYLISVYYNLNKIKENKVVWKKLEKDINKFLELLKNY